MATKNLWFKHYNDASESLALKNLWAERDFETICYFWRILELVSKHEDPEHRGTIALNFALIRREFSSYFPTILRRFTILQDYNLIEVQTNIDTKIVHIRVHKWVELQENRGGKRESNDGANDVAKTGQKPTDIRYKSKNKDKDNIKSGKPDDVHPFVNDVVEHLNNVCGTKYKSNSKQITKFVNARIKEGFTLQDFKSVINAKHQEWGDGEFAKYLRPETLFGGKFESYLQTASSHKELEDFALQFMDRVET